MRRLITSIVLVAALAVPASALAGLVIIYPPLPDTEYQGRIEGDPHTFIGFDLGHVNGKTKVKHFSFSSPFFCRGAGNPDYAHLETDAKFTVHDHRFGGTRQHLEGNTTINLTVHGKLRRHGKARGIFRFEFHNASRDCYSGLYDWHAKRGAEVTVENPPPPGP